MSERQQGPADIPTGQRMKDIGTAMASGMGKIATGQAGRPQAGEAYIADPAHVEDFIRDWPAGPAQAARQMMEQYGPPNEATPIRLVWYRNGPWKRTEVVRDEIAHNFPAPHTDYLTNWIDYHAPVEAFDDLAQYDGSCLLDRTAGEACARCDSEAANFITLNLMHEIVTGARTVEAARKVYAEQMSAFLMGREAPYAERLLFDPPSGGTADLDEAIIAAPMARQMAEKAKDVIRGEPKTWDGER